MFRQGEKTETFRPLPLYQHTIIIIFLCAHNGSHDLLVPIKEIFVCETGRAIQTFFSPNYTKVSTKPFALKTFKT